jgi:YidC/Oxa1 family membrane protein insertase
MDTQRIILFFIFAFSVLMLGDQWFREQRQAQPAEKQVPAAAEKGAADGIAPGAPAAGIAVPTPTPEKLAPPVAAPAGAEAGGKLGRAERIRVTTDLIIAEIDTAGGDLRHLEMLRHKHVHDYTRNFVLLQDSGEHTYVAQSGLIGEGLPNHRSRYRSQVTGPVTLAEGQDTVTIRLEALDTKGATVAKIYTFRRGSYLIEVSYEVRNTGTEPLGGFGYFQLVRDRRPPVGDSWLVPTYTGFVVYTDAEKYQKVSFDDIETNRARFARHASDGWLGISQHYFVSAWLPPDKLAREFFLRPLEGGLFAGGIIVPMTPIAPGATGTLTVPLYSGPQEQDKLGALARGLDLTVDYGMFTIFSTPLFWLLKWIHGWVGNWGVAIIILTFLIKLAFYPLSATSYKSMARMRVLAPKMQRLKEQYGDDRQKMQQAMMEMYRTEKINPLGGCLPIVVQIPIFIALYWVLLGSVELRQAPFFGWVTDLSVPDPWFILPLLMGGTMIIQMRLSPEPPDPIQAKVMKVMPIVFSIFFFFFPAGLVLYWLVNNILSIAQQWYVTKQIEAEKAVGPHAGKR